MTPLLVIDRLTVWRDKREILSGVTLTVEPGEICALFGASGAGKSTILRAVAALQSFDSGTISVGDTVLRPGPVLRESGLRALRDKVGMVFQSHALFEHLTALENVTLALRHVHRMDAAEADERATKLLASLGVLPRAGAYPRQLSGGEAQRVAIARALASQPSLLLMDEPTSALDPARREALGASLREIALAGKAILIATHDIEFARSFADRCIALESGRIVVTERALL